MQQLGFGASTAVAPEPDAALSQWSTPRWLARRMVEWGFVIPGMRVLEPSVGSGTIVEAVLDAGGDVFGFEIDPRMAVYHPLMIQRGADIHTGDFLAVEHPDQRCDLCVMNPPYEGGLDVAFVRRALKSAPRVIALLRTSSLHGVDRQRDLWRHVRVHRMAHLVRRPDFGGDQGAKTDYTVFDLTGGEPFGTQTPSIEWW